MIQLTNISKSYTMGKVVVRALQNVSLHIGAGEFVAIMGPSGSGKSTLLHVLGFLHRPDAGSYLLGTTETTGLNDDERALLRNRVAGFIFQQFHLLPRMSALSNVEMPMVYGGIRNRHEIAKAKIKDVGLEPRGLHQPNELSGGEQQRVAIARSLVNDPLIIFADEPTGNLDSKSKQEIMAILESLNKKGITLVIVTHEDEVAHRARRIIRMRDGVVVSDEPSPTASSYPARQDVPANTITNRLNSVEHKFQFYDHFLQAARAIFAHKVRSFLSVLGIVIGVAAVIAMIALGQGANESISKSLSSLGSNLLMVRPGSHQTHGVSLEAGAVTRLTIQDADTLAKLPELTAVSPSVRGRGQVVYADKNWNTQLTGCSSDYQTMRASVPTSGRFFSKEEVQVRQKVAVIGMTVVRQLFGESNPIGAQIKLNRINFTVVGVLPEKGANAFQDQDDIVLIPITTAMFRVLGRDFVDSIDAQVKSAELMDTAQESIRQQIIRNHRLQNEKAESFEIRNMAELQDTIKSTTRTMTMLLGFVAAISLLVGGIGIMNIMIVSVTERTKEIGLRMALGARRRIILSQFLIEAVAMTFSGGAIGIATGVGIAALLSQVAGWATKVSMIAVLLSCGSSIIIGIVFGLFPAMKASRLDPVEALRYE